MQKSFEHIGVHFRKGEYIPQGFRSDVYSKQMVMSESEDETESSTDSTGSDEVKEESDSDDESSSDTW